MSYKVEIRVNTIDGPLVPSVETGARYPTLHQASTAARRAAHAHCTHARQTTLVRIYDARGRLAMGSIVKPGV